jgi:malate dehydrogenase (oxaloacetate-decarboxylating)(NADP+)
MDMPIRRHQVDLFDQPVLPVHKRGRELLSDPLLNKGTGFPDSERDALGIRGLVPPQVVSIDDQVQRVMENYATRHDDLDRYIYLETLHDRNETLYYRVLMDHIREMTPIVYTPTVGKACQQFGHIYRRARGMYLNANALTYFHDMVNNWPEEEIDIVVVTDGSRILGLGDLGANGMGIPIGKLSLYVAGAGLYPCKTLPVMLDMGTNNAALRDDNLYLGERRARIGGEEYDRVVQTFVEAVHRRWPKALIQFEDFSNDHAFTLLQRYRHRVPSFNDDIQGTGAVALSGLLAALRITGESLSGQRILFLGAGSAARGIADMLVAGMIAEGNLDLEQARRQIWMIDSHGLVTWDRLDELAEHKKAFAQDAPAASGLAKLIGRVRPNVLIGVSGQGGAFDEASLREMSRHVGRPIVFALSNPTVKAECSAEQAYAWSSGRALFASGSPFSPVMVDGKLRKPGQCNNMYIFPGVGLGAVTFQAAEVTDSMFSAAARTLAEQVDEDDLSSGSLFPDLGRIREISARIAAAVGEVAYQEGLAGAERPDDLLAYVQKRQFQPSYLPYQAV